MPSFERVTFSNQVHGAGRTLAVASIALSQYGAPVTTARSGAEALAAMNATPPDVLVSDLGMPGLDGFGLMHLSKPFDPRRLAEAVGRLAGRM